MRHLLSVTLLLAVAALPARAADETGAPHLALATYQLDNGLQVVLHEDHTLPLVHVNLWYHVGSGDEVPGKGGLAHFCEHMMFEGSKHVAPGEHFRVLGVAGNPDANATTNANRTNYFETVPAHQLETVLRLESDRMGYLAGALDEERFENQREVVRNERRQRYENSAYGPELFAIAAALYPEGHPMRNLTIGLHQDIEKLTLEDARAFLRKWYVPANATLVVAGDFVEADARAMIEKWFGTLPAAAKPTHKVLITPPILNPIRKVVNDPFTNLRRIHYVWPGLKGLLPEDLALDVLANVLGRVPTGRLYRRFVGGQLAQFVGVRNQSNNFVGEFHIYIDVRPNVELAAVETMLQGELRALASQPIDPRELAQAVVWNEVGMVTDAETLSARADSLQVYGHYGRKPDSFEWELSTIRAVTPAALQTLAGRMLGSGRVEVLTMPAGGGQ
jgi:zinc protease